MTHELWKKHRPRTLSEVVGQIQAIAVLSKMIERKEVPHALLLVGPSGVGKNTIARILRNVIGCDRHEYYEINCARDGALEEIRSIPQRMLAAPLSGKCRCWFLDEFQSLSRAGFAQQSLLDALEETPKHVWFFLATTDPSKIIRAIKTRCTLIQLEPIKSDVLVELMQGIAEKESIKVGPGVLDLIAQESGGSAR